jgi:hypothetical protein
MHERRRPAAARKLPAFCKPIRAGFVVAITNPAGTPIGEATMAEITETTIEPENEQAKVESWRLHVLIEAGFPLPLAERLAASDADLHTSVDLLRQGCTPATAAEILL